ncbi:MAG: ArgR family transcriptional regulator [Bacteroidetes bacterium]|jgi:transcriptional regulator of arginine metabolism|nr:ArgR family transcriptional regulator [Bacteroidota bacterium]
MSTKKERQDAIKTIVRETKVGNQDQLLKLLSARGFSLTQATLSRDIRDLKIVKNPVGGGYEYQLSQPQAMRISNDAGMQLSAIGFVGLDFSGNLAVLRTRPGYAMGIASEIDQKASDIILGTVAGDDTVLVIPRDNVSRNEVKIALAQFIVGIE